MARTLLIADDHPICAAALAAAALGVDGTIGVETAETIAEVEILLKTKSYDLVMLDLKLRDSQGLGNLTLALAAQPGTPVVVVSSDDSAATIARARALGARGFVSKAVGIADMKRAIASVLDGESWFPEPAGAGGGGGTGSDALAAAIDRLTPAQIRVVNELVRGHSNKVIAYNLSLSEPTVKTHLGVVFRAVGASNRGQAIIALRSLIADK